MNEPLSASLGMSALLSFTAENVRCYRDEVHLSLLGTRMAERGVARRLAVAGTSKPVSVLPAAGIFGANASGKTAILATLDDMREVVMGSFRRKDRDQAIHRRPFLLDNESRQRPSRFEVELILGGVRWQYAFEIDDHRVLGEYAYHFPKGRQALVFHREPGRVSIGAPFRSSARVLRSLARNNVLLLSVAGVAEVEGLEPLDAWFGSNLTLAKPTDRGWGRALTADLLQSPNWKDRVLSLLRYADLGITDAHKDPPDPESVERVRRALRNIRGSEDALGDDDELALDGVVRLTHAGPSGESQIPPEEESQGTHVLLGLIGPVLSALSDGTVLLVDELDASLHSYLVNSLINLFQDQHHNPRCAQLIFNSHDTNILGDSERRTLGRDQIWITEKNLDGVTSLYPLSDFAPRRDDAIERRYLQGRYGGVPLSNPAEIERALETADT